MASTRYEKEPPLQIVIESEAKAVAIKSPVGYRCLLCNTRFSLSAFSGHIALCHPSVHLGTANIFEDNHLRIVHGWVCTTCPTIYFTQKSSNFTRHVKRGEGLKCQKAKEGTHPRVPCRVYACGRFHSLVNSDNGNPPSPGVNQSSLPDWRRAFYENSINIRYELEDNFGMDPTLINRLLPLITSATDGESLIHFVEHGLAYTKTSMPTLFIRSIDDYIRRYARLDAGVAPGNVSHSMASFRELTEYSGGFTSRDNDDVVIAEMVKIARFVFGRIPCISGFTDSYGPLAVPYFFHKLVMEKGGGTTHCIPVLLKYAVFRMFKGPEQCQSLSAISSILASILYIGRQAGISLCAHSHGRDYLSRQVDLAKETNGTHVVNTLARSLRHVREVQNARPTRQGDSIDSDGNITLDGHHITKDKWSKSVPLMASNMETYLLESLLGDRNELKELLGLLLDPESTVKLTVNGGFNICRGAVTISSDRFQLKPNQEDILERIYAFLHVAFHGFGFGPMRFAELDRLERELVSYFCDQIWYWSQGAKRGSIFRISNALVERRLPWLISKLYILAEYLRKSIRYTVKRLYSLQWAFQKMFGLLEQPDLLVIRHFWADVANLIFACNDPNQHVASQAGHSMATHVKTYMTKKELTGMFEEYHLAIGDVKLTPQSLQLCLDDCEQRFKVWKGETAVLRPGQRDLVNLMIVGKSLHATLPTGYGKSIGWLLPTLTAVATGIFFGCTIVVLPYMFLLEYFVAETEKLQIESVSVLSADIMTTGRVPLLEDGLPHIIYMTVDSFSKLFSLGGRYLDNWRKQGLLSRIIVDEIHLLFLESSFRDAYRCLKLIQKPGSPLAGIQMITLSGSLTRGVESVLKRYLGMEESPTVDSASLGLEGIPISLRVLPQQRWAGHIISYIKDRIPFGSIQIFFRDVSSGANLHKAIINSQIGLDYTVRMVTSLQEANAKKECATDWARGDIDILLSTTMGLVGNTNEQLRTVIVIGHIYSVPNLVQALGRLRPNQRNNCEALLFHDGRFGAAADKKRTVEITEPELVDDSVINFIDPKNLTDFYKNTNNMCRQMWLNKFFGYTYETNCGICDECTRTNVVPSNVVAAERPIPKHSHAMAAAFPFDDSERRLRGSSHKLSLSGVRLFSENPTAYHPNLQSELYDSPGSFSIEERTGDTPESPQTQATIGESPTQDCINLPGAASSTQNTSSLLPLLSLRNTKDSASPPAPSAVLPAKFPKIRKNPYAKGSSSQSRLKSNDDTSGSFFQKRPEQVVESLMEQLRNRCFICKKETCDGEAHWCIGKNRCYTCLRELKNDRSFSCAMGCKHKYKTTIQLGWKLPCCKFCWVPNEFTDSQRPIVHHKTYSVCPVSKRFKRMVQEMGDPWLQKHHFQNIASFHTFVVAMVDKLGNNDRPNLSTDTVRYQYIGFQKKPVAKRPSNRQWNKGSSAKSPSAKSPNPKRSKQGSTIASSSASDGSVIQRNIDSGLIDPTDDDICQQELDLIFGDLTDDEIFRTQSSQSTHLLSLPECQVLERQTLRRQVDRDVRLFHHPHTTCTGAEYHINFPQHSLPLLPPDRLIGPEVGKINVGRTMETPEIARKHFLTILGMPLSSASSPDFEMIGCSTRTSHYFGSPHCVYPFEGKTLTINVNKTGFPSRHTDSTSIHVTRFNSSVLSKSGLNLASNVCHRGADVYDIRDLGAVTYDKGSLFGAGFNHSNNSFHEPNGRESSQLVGDYVEALVSASQSVPTFQGYLQELLASWSDDEGTLAYGEAMVGKNLVTGPRYDSNHHKAIIVFFRNEDSSANTSRKLFVCHNLSLNGADPISKPGNGLIVDVTAGGIAIALDPSSIYHSFSLSDDEKDDMFAVFLTDRTR